MRTHEPGSIERTITFGIQHVKIAISRVVRIEVTSSSSSKRNVRINFQSQRSAAQAATLWGGPAIHVPQVAFGKSRNVDAQFPANLMFDIEKRSRFFAMPRVGGINGDVVTMWVLSRCRWRLYGGGVGFAGVLGLEFGDRAGCALSQHDCSNRPAHHGQK
jgi:hypothetical protein